MFVGRNAWRTGELMDLEDGGGEWDLLYIAQPDFKPSMNLGLWTRKSASRVRASLPNRHLQRKITGGI